MLLRTIASLLGTLTIVSLAFGGPRQSSDAYLLGKQGVDDYQHRNAPLKTLYEAIDHLNTAITANELNADAYTQRGRAFRLLKEFDGAVEDLRWAVHLAPSSEAAHYELGAAYQRWFDAICGEVRSGQRRDYAIRENAKLLVMANAEFSEAIRINPKNQRAWCMRGIGLLYVSRFDEAIQDFNRAIQIDARYADAYGHRAIAKIDQWRDGAADLERAIQLDPSSRAYFEYQRREAISFRQWKQAQEQTWAELQAFVNRAFSTYQPQESYTDEVCSKCGRWYRRAVGCSHN
ncbi:MAG: tetratricopeptide repeat protein [Candidatus Schekmanbacteria bacterium]|nr:tetratricopeptide repeat protein [Candidatus Schekmanbacteria bacterium]